MEVVREDDANDREQDDDSWATPWKSQVKPKEEVGTIWGKTNNICILFYCNTSPKILFKFILLNNVLFLQERSKIWLICYLVIWKYLVNWISMKIGIW